MTRAADLPTPLLALVGALVTFTTHPLSAVRSEALPHLNATLKRFPVVGLHTVCGGVYTVCALYLHSHEAGQQVAHRGRIQLYFVLVPCHSFQTAVILCLPAQSHVKNPAT